MRCTDYQAYLRNTATILVAKKAIRRASSTSQATRIPKTMTLNSAGTLTSKFRPRSLVKGPKELPMSRPMPRTLNLQSKPLWILLKKTNSTSKEQTPKSKRAGPWRQEWLARPRKCPQSRRMARQGCLCRRGNLWRATWMGSRGWILMSCIRLLVMLWGFSSDWN